MASSSPFTTEGDCFFFETDHLALRGNKDYCEVLKTIVKLTAQREKLIKDYNKVVEIKKNVLEDSDNVLNKLKNGEDLGIELPPMIDLPKIWSAEEQKKLEELLLKYPPEPIERRRFQKIAKELGNRSVTQVASRIQKYFLKLYKAGLPIPGRIPKSLEKNKKSFLHKHQRHNHYLWKPTTFFPEFNPPVTMNELDSIPGPSMDSKSVPHSSSAADNYLLETDYHKNAEITNKTKAELQLQLLKKIREMKLKEQESSGGFQHNGYKCDYCNSEPIIGTRWQCTVCPQSVDFCTDCLVSQMYTNNSHPVTHPMVVYQDDQNHTISHGNESSSKNVKIKEEICSDSSDSEFDNNAEKEDNEEGSGTDEESRSNFDSDLN